MSTILFRSVSDKELRNFRILKWNSSNNRADSATKTSWQVKTLYHKFNFIDFLKMKMFLFGLDEDLYRCLIDAPGVLTDELFVSAIIAKRIVMDEKRLLQRLNILQRLTNRREWNTNLYYSLNQRFGYEILEVRQATRKADKFSGYVKNSSAVGSKSSNRIFIPEPELVEWSETVKIDFLNFLTVGDLSSGTPGGNLFTLTRAKSSKR